MHWISDQLAVAGLSDLDFAAPLCAVLNVCESRPYDPPARLAFLHRGFPDVQPFSLETVWSCVRWLDSQLAGGGKALVHCAEGNSRSVTVVICYFLYKGMPLDEIKRTILRAKPFEQLGGKATKRSQYFHDEFLAAWRGHLAYRRSQELLYGRSLKRGPSLASRAPARGYSAPAPSR